MTLPVPASGPHRVPTFEDVLEAEGRVVGVVHRTPVWTCAGLDRLVGASLFFKCENFQKVGAFKFRGATNAVRSLSDREARRGVATHSSGNHAAALALAAAQRGIPAYIVMPNNAPAVKQCAVAGYGARIVFCEPTLEARETTLNEVLKETGATFIHPYDDARVIAGQGTAAFEFVQDVPDLDVVMVPVGGGGLLAGTILSVRARSRAMVVAAEPSAADDAFRSLAAGHIIPSVNPCTMADGLLTSLGKLNFEIIRGGVGRIVTVGEPSIARALRLFLERVKIVIEPSSAVPLGALLEGGIDVRGQRVGVVLSGGNLDWDRLSQCLAVAADPQA
jgi:threonine dehydratase